MQTENFSKAIQKFSLVMPQIETAFFRCDVHLSRIMTTAVSRSYPLHRHTYYELHIPIFGMAEYLVDGDTHICTPENALLIAPNYAHQHVRSENYAAVTLGFTFTAPASLTGQTIPGSAYMAIPVSTDIQNALIYILHTLQNEATENYFIFNSLYTVIFYDLLMGVPDFQARLKSSPRNLNPENTSNQTRIQKAMQYIRDNLVFPVSTEDVANHLNLSARQLNRILKQELHLSINQLINDVRIQEAQRLIEATDLSLSKIASQCGFNSPTHFNLTFKKIAGITPKLYRDRVQK